MFYAIFFAKSLICIVIIPWLFFCDCFYLRNVPHLASRGTVPVSNFQQLPDRKKPPQLTLCWKLAGGNLSSSPSSLWQLPFILKKLTKLLKKDQTIRIRIYKPPSSCWSLHYYWEWVTTANYLSKMAIPRKNFWRLFRFNLYPYP